MASSTPLPSRKQLLSITPGHLDEMHEWHRAVVLAVIDGRYVDRKAIDRDRIEEILNELCRDWGESLVLEGAGYDFGRAIDAIAEAIDV